MLMGEKEESRHCYENAIRLLRILPAASPDYANALAHLGSLETLMHQYEEAETPLRSAQEVDFQAGNHVGLQEIALYRTSLELARNNTRDARRFLADAFREAAQAKNLSLRDRATMYSVAGSVAARSNDFSGAVRDYQQSDQACGSRCYYTGLEYASQADAYRELADYPKAQSDITKRSH
jgi:hypothetical protein